MNYKHLIDAIKKYGSTEEDICLHGTGVRPDQINENVILAPWWEPDILQDLGDTEYLSESPSASIKVWNIKNNSLNITYIKTGIGAPVLMDTLLSLGVTKCRRAIFIGSVGSLDPQINIGDIVIPEYSICGDGASRYITADTLTRIDTSFAQFAHIEEITAMGCNIIEMETAAAFRAAKTAAIPLTALFSVSDNTITNKSLISGRTKEEIQHRKFTRNTLIPQILLNTFKDPS